MSIKGIVRSQLGLDPVDTALALRKLGGADDPKTKLMGAGTSTTPAASSEADTRFLNFNLDVQAASGDNRGCYLRTHYSGGGGGDCLRVYAVVKADAGTVHGMHCSLDFDAAKNLSGQGIAARCTLHVPNDASATGTLAAVQAEAFMNGTSADPSGATHGLIRAIVDGGDATAQARFKNFLLGTLPAGAHNSGNMFITSNGGTCTHMLKAVVNGTTVYFMMSTTPMAP